MKIISINYPSPLEYCDPENGNLDVHVTLQSGQVYSLVVATPNNIYWCMENEGINYFFGIPPVFVKRLTRINIEKALKELFKQDGGKWIGIYGALQSHIPETE